MLTAQAAIASLLRSLKTDDLLGIIGGHYLIYSFVSRETARRGRLPIPELYWAGQPPTVAQSLQARSLSEATARRGKQRLVHGHLAIFAHAGEGITIEAKSDAKLLVMDGEPIAEPVVGHRPFVMNSRVEIQQAFEDYQLGRMGEIQIGLNHSVTTEGTRARTVVKCSAPVFKPARVIRTVTPASRR